MRCDVRFVSVEYIDLTSPVSRSVAASTAVVLSVGGDRVIEVQPDFGD